MKIINKVSYWLSLLVFSISLIEPVKANDAYVFTDLNNGAYMLYKYDIDSNTYTFVSQSPYSSGQSITPAESFINASEQKLYIKYSHGGNEWYQTW